MHHASTDPALTISLALAAGLIAQALAQHLRIPGIVLLLLAGGLLGPDGLGVIEPTELGTALQKLVGFAVAVILFEGGLNLDLRRLRRESASIRRLVTVGALVTAVGGALSARWILGWDWQLSILFGTLVIVTGPTVITPLLRRIKLNKNLSTVLEAEGVLIDPVGAIIAVVALDVVLEGGQSALLGGVGGVLARLGLGLAIGLGGGFALGLLLKPRRLVPEGLHNVFALSMVLALFHLSDRYLPESGIMTVTVAGMVVGNLRGHKLRDLMEFKEQLTVMLIGMLFVLLAADVRLADLRALGGPGLLTVLALIFVVRPLNVIAGTAGSGMKIREQLFMSWLAPRGIVAAAVASFFAVALENAGIEGGVQLRAMVFLVIAITVTLQGLTGGLLASGLGVRRPANQGWAILGANDLARAMARALRAGGQDVLFFDSNADAFQAAQREGFRVVFGNALEDRTLQRAQLDTVAGAIGLTPNEEVNLLFARRARREYKVPTTLVAMHLHEGHVTCEMVSDAGARVLFGVQRDTDLWAVRVSRKTAHEERWRMLDDEVCEEGDRENVLMPEGRERPLLPLVRYRKGQAVPVDETVTLEPGDELALLLFQDRRAEAEEWLACNGWVRLGEPAGQA